MRSREKSGVASGTLAVCMLAASAVAATAGRNATQWNTPETYQYLAAFSETSSPSITVTLQARSDMGTPANAVVLAKAGTGENAFFMGDYSSLSGVRFKMVSDGKPVQWINMFLTDGMGRLWKSGNVPAPTADGAPLVHFVSFDRITAGWKGVNGTEEQKNAAWALALSNVRDIGVQFIQGTSDEQKLAVADFRLEASAYVTEPASLTRMEGILWGAYSVLAMASVSDELDSDGDSMTDLEELIAGTDANSSASVFDLRIVTSASEGTLIEWPCVEGGRYDVMTRANLSAQPVVIATGLQPSAADLASGKMRFVVNDDEGVAFFAVGVQ